MSRTRLTRISGWVEFLSKSRTSLCINIYNLTPVESNSDESYTRLSIIIECFPVIYKTVNYYWMFLRHIQDCQLLFNFPRHIQDCQLLLNVSPSYTRLSIIIECFPVIYKTVNYYWMFPRHIQDCQLLLNVSPSYTKLSIIIRDITMFVDYTCRSAKVKHQQQICPHINVLILDTWIYVCYLSSTIEKWCPWI